VAFPLALVVVLLWQRRKLAQPVFHRTRYSEPDSIPIDLRPEIEITPGDAAGQPQAAAEMPQEPDDLKLIEGIGPSISRLLHNSGITTFRQLAETPLDQLDEILRSANLRRLADPGAWSEQARLAAGGNWAGLEQLQATLKGGRRHSNG